jgi:hypothetical protein
MLLSYVSVPVVNDRGQVVAYKKVPLDTVFASSSKDDKNNLMEKLNSLRV